LILWTLWASFAGCSEKHFLRLRSEQQKIEIDERMPDCVFVFVFAIAIVFEFVLVFVLVGFFDPKQNSSSINEGVLGVASVCEAATGI